MEKKYRSFWSYSLKENAGILILIVFSLIQIIIPANSKFEEFIRVFFVVLLFLLIVYFIYKTLAYDREIYKRIVSGDE